METNEMSKFEMSSVEMSKYALHTFRGCGISCFVFTLMPNQLIFPTEF